MKIAIREIGMVTVVRVEESLLQETVADFQKIMADLHKRGKTRVVLDLYLTQYISSVGLSVISSYKLKFTASKGDLKIAQVNDLIKKLLISTNLIKKIEVFDALDQAVESFRAR